MNYACPQKMQPTKDFRSNKQKYLKEKKKLKTGNAHTIKKQSSLSVIQIFQLQKKRFFNSNFPCKCSYGTKSTNNERGKFTVKYKSSKEKGNKKTKLSKINEFLDEHVLTSNFEYYQTYDFYKLSAKTAKEKRFRLMYTNICSLRAIVEHLDIFLDQFNFSFDFLAVSETQTAKFDHMKNIPRLKNYQSFVGTEGVATKSWCGFYIGNGIKYKQRKNLDISYYDDNNELQSSWIEIIKEYESNIIAGVF